MSKRAVIGEAEYLEPADYNRFGEFPQEALDHVVAGAIGYPAHWSAFTVSLKSAQEVTVSPGRYFENEAVFSSDAAVDINLIQYFPLAASDEKWLALILRGEDRVVTEDRAFETSEDPETSQPVSIATPVIAWRAVNVVVQQGAAVPAPATQPTIAETDACIAFVRVTTTGIQEIVPGDNWRVKTLYEVENRVSALEVGLLQLVEDTETIRTDLGNVAADVIALRNAIPDRRLFNQIVRDTARLSQAMNLPDEARNYWFDQALLKDDWDFTAGGFFRIDEGIRFQYGAQRDHLLRLQAYDDPNISVWDNRLIMPAYTEVARISSPEGKVRKDISNTVHTITTATKKTKSHTRIRYGETVNVCENTAGWEQVGARKANEVFKANGEEWVSKGLSSDPWNDNPASDGGHKNYAVQRVIKETYKTTYTVYNTEEFGLSGAIFGQTFLSAQVMVATSVDLYFTRVGPTGDVTLCLCEVNGSGAPDFDAVLATATVARNNLVNGWNKFAFEPTLLDQGKRYAWFTVTTGNHQLMANSGNAFAGGTSFVSTDGAWAQGSTTEDFTFRLNAARFKSSRVVLPMLPLELESGMTEIQMIFKAWEPASTSLAFEVRVPGENTPWILMDARENNPLANLPPLVNIRAVMVGTEDVAPAIDLDQYARAISGRHRTDMRAISKLLDFGFATDSAQVVLNMDYFDAAKHTASPKLMLADGTVVNPVSVTPEIDPTKTTRTKFTANFDLPVGTTQARVRIEATTDSVIDVPFGQDVQANFF